MTRHKLKTWPDYFNATVNGTKTFELRINDRDYKVGDVLELIEYDIEHGDPYHTGRSTEVIVTYILDGREVMFGLYSNAVIMSIKPTEGSKLRAQKATSTDPDRLERMAVEADKGAS